MNKIPTVCLIYLQCFFHDAWEQEARVALLSFRFFLLLV